MHIEFRRVMTRHFRVWWFKYGFGVWIGRRLFSVGHDTRGRTVAPRR